MAASASDLFQKVGRSTATTLSAPGYTVGAASINVGSTSNWPTDTGITFAIDEVVTVDGEEERVAGTYNIFRGTVASGTSINNLTYVGGDANRNYSAGATTRVYILVSYYRENRLVDGLLVEHDQDGTHGNITAGTIAASGVVSVSTHIDINDSSTAIRDSSDNELVKFAKTASAVNEVTVTNAATGGAPIVEATGGDANIHLVARAKGNGLTKVSVLRQDDTSNSYKHNSVILTGWGVLPTAANSAKSETITFGITFAQAPIVVASYGGDNTSGTATYGAGSVANKGVIAPWATSITTTSFFIRIQTGDGSNWGAGDTVFYQWIAVGELA